MDKTYYVAIWVNDEDSIGRHPYGTIAECNLFFERRKANGMKDKEYKIEQHIVTYIRASVKPHEIHS